MYKFAFKANFIFRSTAQHRNMKSGIFPFVGLKIVLLIFVNLKDFSKMLKCMP